MTASTSSNRRLLIAGMIVAGLLAGLLAGWIAGLWIGQEDAHITYTYAKRIAQGYGFSFSPGAKPSLGTTTPLYTLILALFAAMGGPPHVVSNWIGALCHSVIAILLIALARKGMGPWLSISCGIFWSLSLNIFFRCGGMETPLLMLFLVGLALSEFHQQASPHSAVLIGLLLLCRPDSLLIALLCFGFWTLSPHTRPRVVRASIISALICLPWILYAWYIFGSIIPSSLIAKLLIPGQSGRVNLSSFLFYFFPSHKLFPVVVAFCLVGAVALWRAQQAMRPFLLWLPLYYASLRLGMAPDFAWYYAPPLWLAPVLLNQGFLTVFDRLLPKLKVIAVPMYVLLSLIIWTQGNLDGSWPVRRNLPTCVQKELALIARQKAQPQDLIASFEVGALAYYSNRPVLDLLALTSPEVLPWARKRDFVGVIRHFQPKFLMVSTMNGRNLGYREVARMPFWAGDYILWERQATPGCCFP